MVGSAGAPLPRGRGTPPPLGYTFQPGSFKLEHEAGREGSTGPPSPGAVPPSGWAGTSPPWVYKKKKPAK